MAISEKVALQQVILPVLAAAPIGRLEHLGTAFVIAAFGRQSLLMTAAHVIRQAVKLDGNWPRHHPSALPEFLDRNTKQVLREVKLHVHYRKSETYGHLANIRNTYINEPSDTALLVAEFGNSVPENVLFQSRLSIDSSPPVVGTPIISSGYGDSKMEFFSDPNPGHSKARFHHKLEYRHGSVTELLGRDDPNFRHGPGFRINAVISSGMSGGPVIDKRYGDQVVACGINSSDFSFDDNKGVTGSGERSTCQALWPAMAITIENAEINGVRRPARVLELVKHGFITDLGDPVRHVVGIPEPGITDFTIAWK